MILYGLKTCDTCRKALKLLPDAEFRDIRAEAVPENVLKSAHAAFGARLVNTRSTTWRALDSAERARTPLELLSEYPTLMKRPLILHDGRLFLGWGSDVQSALIG